MQGELDDSLGIYSRISHHLCQSAKIRLLYSLYIILQPATLHYCILLKCQTWSRSHEVLPPARIVVLKVKVDNSTAKTTGSLGTQPQHVMCSPVPVRANLLTQKIPLQEDN